MKHHAERRKALLETAEGYVNNDRNTEYSEPTEDFGRIVGMWNAYLYAKFGDGGEALERHDVSALMILMKLSRTMGSPAHEDSWIDIAGYAACGYDCAMTDLIGPDDEADMPEIHPEGSYYFTEEQLISFPYIGKHFK